jgi:hypothetical protein
MASAPQRQPREFSVAGRSGQTIGCGGVVPVAGAGRPVSGGAPRAGFRQGRFRAHPTLGLGDGPACSPGTWMGPGPGSWCSSPDNEPLPLRKLFFREPFHHEDTKTRRERGWTSAGRAARRPGGCMTGPAAWSGLAQAVRPWAATPPPWAGSKTGSPVVVRRRPWRRRSLPAAGGSGLRRPRGNGHAPAARPRSRGRVHEGGRTHGDGISVGLCVFESSW